MPTYAYACTSCEHRFEVQQSFSDSTLTECPECEGRIRKLFNSVGIVFKGSGFYRTDSRGTTSGDSPASSDKPAPSSTEKPAEKKSGATTSSNGNGAAPAKAKGTSSSSSAA
ncbi:MAG TPA: FmdB family zinc ribbon protein [Actinomycetales bacterium]|nr:FmdB family zinc ribbon protein [Actinomycetales bacterium]